MALKMTMMLTAMTAPDRTTQKCFSALMNSPKSETQIYIAAVSEALLLGLSVGAAIPMRL